MKPDRFFATLIKFTTAFDQARQAEEAKRLAGERAERIRARRASMPVRMVVKPPQPGDPPTSVLAELRMKVPRRSSVGEIAEEQAAALAATLKASTVVTGAVKAALDATPAAARLRVADTAADFVRGVLPAPPSPPREKPAPPPRSAPPSSSIMDLFATAGPEEPAAAEEDVPPPPPPPHGGLFDPSELMAAAAGRRSSMPIMPSRASLAPPTPDKHEHERPDSP